MLFISKYLLWQTEFRTLGAVGSLRLSGRVDAAATGPPCDQLVERLRPGQRQLIVECAPGVSLARPGVRGLVVAATLIRAAGGQFRLVAEPALTDGLHRVSLRHLLPISADLPTALAMVTALATATQPPVSANRSARPADPSGRRAAQGGGRPC